MSKKTIVVHNVDVELLKQQREILLKSYFDVDMNDAIEGILNLLDAMIDSAEDSDKQNINKWKS